MEQTMKSYLFRLLNHEELTREEMKTILIGITHSEYPNEQITALLTCLQMRGVTVDELLGFRDGILETGVPAILQADRYIDVVGTGGDRKNTFNISTTACFVIAGAGYKVAKHGNYAATSVSGASNVIQHHGIKFTDDIDKLNRSLNEAGIVYLHAQLFAKAMKFVGPIRKALQFPTIFNLLGPIVNPSQPKCQLLGVANLDQMRLYNNVYQKLGIDYGIVNSIDGYDEISLTGPFKVTTKQYERIFQPHLPTTGSWFSNCQTRRACGWCYRRRSCSNLRLRTREPRTASPEEYRVGKCCIRHPSIGTWRERHRGVH